MNRLQPWTWSVVMQCHSGAAAACGKIQTTLEPKCDRCRANMLLVLLLLLDGADVHMRALARLSPGSLCSRLRWYCSRLRWY